LILFVLTIFNCKQDDIQDVDFNSIQNQKETINHFTIEDLPDIEHALNKIGSNTTGRLMTTTFGDLDLSDILQFVNVDGKESYSFRILNSNNSQSQTDFENLHLIKLPEDDGYLAYIIQWQPDPDWYIDNSYIFNIETFSGVMNRFDLDYNLLDSKEFIDGIDVDEQDDNNRTMDNGCDVLQYTVCVDTDDCSCTPDDCYEVIEITCSSGGGGDGGNTGDGNLPNEEGGTGSHVPGGSTPGGTNTGEFVPGGNGTVVAIPPKPSEVFNSFDGITLTLQQAVWVNKESNEEEVAQLLGFILEHCQSDVVTELTCGEAKEFDLLALEAMMNGGVVEFDELYISVNVPDDDYVYLGSKELIPNPLVLSNGDEITVTFGTTKDLINANQPVSIDLIDGIKFAIEEANSNLSSTDQITSIHIMATTNGHGSTGSSNHLKATAVDISRINDQKMIITGVNDQIIQLQTSMDNFSYVRENFGPYFKHKYSIETNTWNYNYNVSGHNDHIHFSVRR
jgi:hypothetical protein